MPPKPQPKYCAQCAQPVITRVVDDRPRRACSGCGTIYYENPLPVAASVVLNERREVLLVKRAREPHQGQWCLPMGFAEVGETIDEAALRELEEETGITACVLQLLDSDSYNSDFYGELLIVTFEMQKTGGREAPGDDAEDVRYVPIGQLPPLAFSSNEKALRACVAAHQEAWVIEDSFVRLQRAEDQALLSDDLVRLIEEHAGEIAERWLEDVRTNVTTPSYRAMQRGQLLEKVTATLSQFGRWLGGADTADELRAFYPALGQERQAQGFKMHEVLSAIALLKKHLWAAAQSRDVWNRPIDAYRMLELSRRISIFFDRAMYHTARGFGVDGPPAG